ncbi:MAG: hypothetical protein E6Q98_18170 [Rhodospirillaceae bacterium]|nr:MAG: hypothetical protein E6Q98_18170 [Rhodospirillaceae bacterium]
MSRKPVDTRQLTLDAMFMAPAPAPRQDAGSLDISLRVREELADTLARTKEASGGERDRYAIAAEISRLAGRDFTKNMLDRCTAPSAEDWRFPLEALPALIQATGDYHLLDLVAEACGCRVLRREEAWIAEFGSLLAAQKELRDRIATYKNVLPTGMADALIARAQSRHGGSE